MNREEAKIFLYSIAGDLGFTDVENYTCKDGEKMREAIEALEQEPCKDSISRQAVLDLAKKNGIYTIMCKAINELLSVNPQPKTGHWIVHPKGIYAHLVCDKCLSNAPYDCRTNYCPNCGARMVES